MEQQVEKKPRRSKANKELALSVPKPTGEIQVTKTPDDMIIMALEKGLPVETLSKIMDLRDRVKAGFAREEFLEALAKFQSLVPELKKVKTVNYQRKDGGFTKYNYTPLSEIAKQIKSAMEVAGLTYQFKIKDDATNLSVTCILTHVHGHAEETTMTAAPDDSGNKNSIQGRGSTITYLQRYTLIGALGITTADQDDDGQGAGKKKEAAKAEMTAKQFEGTLEKVQKKVLTVERVKQHFALTPDQESQLIAAETKANTTPA